MDANAVERFKVTAAVYLFLIRRDKVLLARRANTGYEDGNYSLPAGHLDGGETARAAMVREAREEIGIVIQPSALNLVHVMHRNDHSGGERLDLYFTALGWNGEPAIMEPKCDSLEWFPFKRLPSNIIPYIRQAIDCYRRGVNYSEFGF